MFDLVVKILPSHTQVLGCEAHTHWRRGSDGSSVRLLIPTWEIWMEFYQPLGLAHSLAALWAFGKSTSKQQHYLCVSVYPSLSLCLSNKQNYIKILKSSKRHYIQTHRPTGRIEKLLKDPNIYSQLILVKITQNISQSTINSAKKLNTIAEK